MNKYRLLIADSDKTYAEHLSSRLSKKNSLKIIGIAHDGIQAMKMIRIAKPDIILMDPLLPEMDGISVLKSTQKMKRPPAIIFSSQFYNSVSIEMARRNGASYYVYKPLDIDSLSSILIECAETIHESNDLFQKEDDAARYNELQHRIYDIMQQLGFSAKHNGSRYIAHSVALAVESPMILHNLSSGLYKQIAEKAQVSTACVERSIRTAITSANVDGRLTAIIGSVPTNKTCIRHILKELNFQ